MMTEAEKYCYDCIHNEVCRYCPQEYCDFKEKYDGWISVEDKMPDECQEVLIYCPEFLEEIRKAFYTEGDFYVEKEDLIVEPAPNGYCTHWMPLPKQPKEDE